MTRLVYDGSWTGFLSAVFEVYERKLTEAEICAEYNYRADLLYEALVIYSNEEKARRVWMGLSKRLSAGGLKRLYMCFLSEQPEIERPLLQFIQLAFKVNDAEKAYANSSVLQISQVAKMVYREKHRMEAFVRFQLTKDGIYFAKIEPDFNVLPLISSHFEKRYADQKWLIYDLRRNYGIYYDFNKVEEITVEFSERPEGSPSSDIFSEEEAVYQTLWKDYFQHVNIKERKNSKLHLKHVPKRYWKHLTEKL